MPTRGMPGPEPRYRVNAARWLWLGLALAHSLPALSSEATPATTAAALAKEVSSGAQPGVTSFLVGDSNRRLLGHVDPALADAAPDLRSATKSITALLVGIAVDRGHIGSVDEAIAPHLPEYAARFAADPRKAALTWADLLTMRSGLECDDWSRKSRGHEDRMYRKRDWVGFWIAQGIVVAPGSRFSYCTGNVIALGKALSHAVGQPLDEFARTALFEPLGIGDARWERWNRKREIDSGGHLRLSPDSLLRIGQLVLRRGEWNGTQVVSTAWVDAMTTEHTPIPDHGQRYGYLWWLDATRNPALPRTRLQMAWGNGGNYLFVMPELDRVVVFTGTRFNQPDAMQPLLWLRDLLPEFADPGSGSASH